MMKGEAFLQMCSNLYPKWDHDWCGELVRTLDINLRSQLKELSRGTLVKLKLISPLAFRPKLLLLDEPFSGLDPIVRDETISVIIELCQRSGATVFVSSHDLHEVERIADSVLFLNHGTIKEHASLDSLLERYRAVSLTLEEGTTLPANHPAHWANVDHSGRSVQFVHRIYSPERLTEELAALQVQTTAHEAAPLTLKEIYRAVMEAR
jgi:ABC-2 type transport system ATP-binding protein